LKYICKGDLNLQDVFNIDTAPLIFTILIICCVIWHFELLFILTGQLPLTDYVERQVIRCANGFFVLMGADKIDQRI
jgi:hypothetical protein